MVMRSISVSLTFAGRFEPLDILAVRSERQHDRLAGQIALRADQTCALVV